MALGYENRWEIVKPLGGGGQGQVSLVRDTHLYTNVPFFESFLESLRELGAHAGRHEGRKQAFAKFREGILDMIRSESPLHQGALKVLHKADDARDPERASERIGREIRAMSQAAHPNLLRILDSNAEEEWFVSEFHPNGILQNNLHRFKGNLPKALRAFRPLVAAVAELHAKGMVHRDIKPANVFLSSKDDLVLGDFGLVYFVDDARSRLSGTFDNVGTRDWMPGWAMGQRIDDVLPSFDVFGLGKLLWAMVCGQPFLRLWYFNREGFDVERLFPNSQYIGLANQLFRYCIVEDEGDCLPNAGELLGQIDRVLRIIELQGDAISDNADRPCRVCGIGSYQLVVNRNPTGMRNFGIHAVGTHSLKIFACSHCGHVQLFSFYDPDCPPAWSKA
ncbi:MAG: protein kinase [Planctomycetota bacterium]